MAKPVLDDAWVEHVFQHEDIQLVCAVNGMLYSWLPSRSALLQEIFEREHENDAVVRYLEKRERVFASLDDAKAFFLQRNVGQK